MLVSLFSVGGGYAAMPVLESQVVEGAGWMSPSQFADIITISEMTPGPIVLNAATFTGQQMAGTAGALVATAGSVFPAVIIVSAIAYFYYRNKGQRNLECVMSAVRPAVAAMIMSAALSLIITAVRSDSWIMDASGLPLDVFAVCSALAFLWLIRKKGVSPVTVICASAVVGIVVYGLVPMYTGDLSM